MSLKYVNDRFTLITLKHCEVSVDPTVSGIMNENHCLRSALQDDSLYKFLVYLSMSRIRHTSFVFRIRRLGCCQEKNANDFAFAEMLHLNPFLISISTVFQFFRYTRIDDKQSQRD